MKKILLLILLTLVVYGFGYSTSCKTDNKAGTSKTNIKKKAVKKVPLAEDEIVFHPLIFISIPFK